MARDIVADPPGKHMHGPGMVPGVRVGDLIFFSAIRGNEPGTQNYPEGTTAQAELAFENLRLVCEGAGITLDEVVKVTLYLHDLKYRQDFHKVWMDIFPVDPPARIAVQVEDANASPNGSAHFALDIIAKAKKG